MQIYVYRNNNQSGPHDEDVIKGQLSSGGLSPNDLGCRVGETEWRRLGDIFPEATPPIAAAVAGEVVNTPTAVAGKSGGGCRSVLATLMILVGFIMFVFGGAAALIVLRNGNSLSCDLADAAMARGDKLAKEIAAAKGTPDEAIKRQQFDDQTKIVELNSRTCGEELSAQRLGKYGGLTAVLLGLPLFIIGIFLRRQPKAS